MSNAMKNIILKKIIAMPATFEDQMQQIMAKDTISSAQLNELTSLISAQCESTFESMQSEVEGERQDLPLLQKKLEEERLAEKARIQAEATQCEEEATQRKAELEKAKKDDEATIKKAKEETATSLKKHKDEVAAAVKKAKEDKEAAIKEAEVERQRLTEKIEAVAAIQRQREAAEEERVARVAEERAARAEVETFSTDKPGLLTYPTNPEERKVLQEELIAEAITQKEGEETRERLLEKIRKGAKTPLVSRKVCISKYRHVRLSDTRRWTVWHDYATGKEKVLTEALKHKDDINIRDSSGQTPLHVAATWSNASTLTTLIEHGADPNIVDNTRQIPLDYAKASEDEAKIKLLMSKTDASFLSPYMFVDESVVR
ncbi:hypothetical protein HOC37_06165 [bacterium]|nr:hypothetical protein [bacterium]MBT4552546.1 hypothetical protein [bacterium]